MEKSLPEGDVFLVAVSQRGEVAAHRFFEFYFSAVVGFHDSGQSSCRFRDRCQVVYIVGRNGAAVCLVIEISVGFVPHDFALSGNDQLAPGEGFFFNALGYDRIDNRQEPAIHAHVLGGGITQPAFGGFDAGTQFEKTFQIDRQFPLDRVSAEYRLGGRLLRQRGIFIGQ